MYQSDETSPRPEVVLLIAAIVTLAGEVIELLRALVQ